MYAAWQPRPTSKPSCLPTSSAKGAKTTADQANRNTVSDYPPQCQQSFTSRAVCYASFLSQKINLSFSRQNFQENEFVVPKPVRLRFFNLNSDRKICRDCNCFVLPEKGETSKMKWQQVTFTCLMCKITERAKISTLFLKYEVLMSLLYTVNRYLVGLAYQFKEKAQQKTSAVKLSVIQEQCKQQQPLQEKPKQEEPRQ